MRRPLKLFVDLIPDLRDLPENLVQELYWKYYLRSFHNWELWGGLLGLVGCIYLWDRCVNLFSSVFSIQWMSFFEIFSLIVFTVLGFLIYHLFMVHAINREIRKQKGK